MYIAVIYGYVVGLIGVGQIEPWVRSHVMFCQHPDSGSHVTSRNRGLFAASMGGVAGSGDKTWLPGCILLNFFNSL